MTACFTLERLSCKADFRLLSKSVIQALQDKARCTLRRSYFCITLGRKAGDPRLWGYSKVGNNVMFHLEVAGPSLWVCSFNGSLEGGHQPKCASECTASWVRSLVEFCFLA